MVKKCEFDLIYVDGSHMAADVLSDAIMSFHLLRVGGALVFDDYAVTDVDTDDLRHPHMAINSFMHLYRNKMNKLSFKTVDKNGVATDLEEALEREGNCLYQMYLVKTAE
jgi:hypothetical protein